MTKSRHRSPSTACAAARDERGVALVIALLAMVLMTALGMALMLVSETETLISANYRDSVEAGYAADAGIERVMQDVLTHSRLERDPDVAGQRPASVTSGSSTARSTPDAARRPHDQPGSGDQHDQLQQDHDVLRRRHGSQRRRASSGARTTRASGCSPGDRSTTSSRRPRSTRPSTSRCGLPTTAPRTTTTPHRRRTGQRGRQADGMDKNRGAGVLTCEPRRSGPAARIA